MLPYFDGERTPNRPDATGHFAGLTTRTTREDIARAVVEGILCSLQDAINAVEAATGNRAQRVLLTGGGARSEAMRRIAPEIFGVDVIVPEPAEYVALGAARQAAWALKGGGSLPEWGLAKEQTFSGKPTPETVDKYQRLRDLTENF